MFEWFYHLLRLKSSREMRQLDAQFRRDMRLNELALARAMAEGLSEERRVQVIAQIEEAERKLEENVP